MTTWMMWTLFTALGLSAYNVCIKLTSGQITMPGYMIVLGTILALSGVAMGYVFKIAGDVTFTPANVKLAALTALSVVAMEIGFFYTYKSGGMLSFTQPIITAVVTGLTLVIGVYFMHEKLTIQQMVGLFLMVAGIVLVIWKSSSNA
jgi:drug/metabolite transporter (DMT)-like permease